MKVLITGGLGLIGSHIAEGLIKFGIEVLVIDNLSVGRKIHLKQSNHLTLSIGDISNLTYLNKQFEYFKPDVVIHAAASFKNHSDWYNSVQSNCLGGVNLIQVSVNYKVKKFVYFQTSLCYRTIHSRSGQTELEDLWPSETVYAITKYPTDLYLQLTNLNFVSYRLSNIIGPRNLVGVVPTFYKQLKIGQNSTITHSRRDFIHVKDLSDVVIRDCLEDNLSGVYNFGSGKSKSITELYQNMAAIMGKPLPEELQVTPIRKDDVFEILLNNNKLMQKFPNLKFRSFNTALKDAIDYYESFGTRDLLTHLNLNTRS